MIVNLLIAIGAGLFVSQIATFSTTIYLHRCQTHYAFELHPSMHWLFRVLLWLTTGQRTLSWVAVHRKHHALSDEEGDPHSPERLGFWKVQLTNWLLYYRETKKPETIEKYGRDIKENAWDRVLFNRGKYGVMLGTGILCLTFGWWGLVAAGVHVLTYVGILTSCVNAIGHHKVVTGYQNYTDEYACKTYNYRLLAPFTGGEGWHNNHHGDPRSAKLGHFQNEPDPAWPVLVMLAKLKLAWGFQMPKIHNTAKSS